MSSKPKPGVRKAIVPASRVYLLRLFLQRAAAEQVHSPQENMFSGEPAAPQMKPNTENSVLRLSKSRAESLIGLHDRRPPQRWWGTDLRGLARPADVAPGLQEASGRAVHHRIPLLCDVLHKQHQDPTWQPSFPSIKTREKSTSWLDSRPQVAFKDVGICTHQVQ